MTPDLDAIEARWEGARWDYWPVGYAPALEEAVRIAHAPNDIHALLARVRILKAALRESRREVHHQDCWHYGPHGLGLTRCSCGADAWNARIAALLGDDHA